MKYQLLKLPVILMVPPVAAFLPRVSEYIIDSPIAACDAAGLRKMF